MDMKFGSVPSLLCIGKSCKPIIIIGCAKPDLPCWLERKHHWGSSEPQWWREEVGLGKIGVGDFNLDGCHQFVLADERRVFPPP